MKSLWLVVGLVVWADGGLGAGVTVSVSPSGNDAGDGSAARPVLTLERARELVRGKAGATVELRGGLYRRSATLELGPEDSGVTWKARDGERVRLSTAIPLLREKGQRVSDAATLERLDAKARGQVWVWNLRELGVEHTRRYPDNFVDAGGLFELFVAGRRLPLARWPNQGAARMVRVTDVGDWSKGPGRRGGAFLYEGDRPKRWKAALEGGVWLDGFWRVPWAPEKVRVESIDVEKKEIRHAVPVQLGIGSKYARPNGDGKEPWYVLNLMEEIDSPGEWAFEFATGKLYVWPPSEGAALELADRTEPLVRLRGAREVRLEGIVFEGGLGDGVRVEGGQGNGVAGCEFVALGKYGVVMDGGRKHVVESSDFHHLGHGGVLASGGDRKTLEPAEFVIRNSHFWKLGEVKRTYAPAVNLSFDGVPAVGMVVANNLIHDLPHAAVLYSGLDHRIEKNEVHNVALDSGDVGAFYTTNDWTSRGNVLRWNFVHHVSGGNAFYIDDGDCGDEVYGNVIYRTAYGPFVGGGHDNRVHGNLIVAVKRGLHLDARGVPRKYNATDRHKMGLLQSVDVNVAPWSVRFPEMARLMENVELPKGTVMERNALVECGEALHLEKGDGLRLSKVEGNVVASRAEAAFVDEGRLDFRLGKGSKLLEKLPELGKIPFGEMGLYVDAWRKVLPGAEETGRFKDRREGESFDSEVDRKAESGGK